MTPASFPPIEGRAPERLVVRRRAIATVSLADARRAAERVFGDGSLYTVAVGCPTAM